MQSERDKAIHRYYTRGSDTKLTCLTLPLSDYPFGIFKIFSM